MVLTDAMLEAMLLHITDTGGPFDPAALFAGVFQSIDDQGVATVQGDVTEGAGDAATRVALTPWGAPHKMQDGRWGIDAPVAEFRVASAAEAQTLAGWFINTAGVAGTLKGFGYFPDPIPLVDENSYVAVVFRLTIDPEGRWSAEVVYNG